MDKLTNVTFIGLGTMGYHIAKHISKNKKIKLTIYNRTKQKALKWLKNYQGEMAKSLADSVNNADIVITCSGRDEDMSEIIFAKNGIGGRVKEKAIFIDHTTTSYNLAIKISKFLKTKNVNFIDAPLSGGESGAINGCLSVMAGGNKNVLNNCKFVMKNYAKNIIHIGTTGYGQLAKMANQICITGVLQGLSEALLFAENENINIEKLLLAISKGAASSWQMENRMLTMQKREFDFGFAIKWMVKDLAYCLDRAKYNKTDLSLTKSVYHKYKQLIENGYDNLDTSALILCDLDKKTLPKRLKK